MLVDYFRHKNLPDLTVVSPDAGGVERARAFAKKLGAPLAIVDKRRVDVDVSEVMNLIGDVRGRSTLIVDDIIDTAGTLVKTAEALVREGSTQVFAAATHADSFGPGGGAHRKVLHQAGGGHGFRAAQRSGREVVEIESVECRGFAGARHSLDSRRNVHQRTFYLILVATLHSTELLSNTREGN